MVEFASAQPVNRKVNNGDRVPFGDDSEIFAEFYRNPVTGKDHIRMAFPGDKHSSYDQPAKDRDKQRYARQWDDYVNQVDRFAGQTRIEELIWLDDATRNQLKALNIFTAEQLANLDDGNMHSVGMGARSLRDKAIRHVADKQRLEAADAGDQEKEELKARLAEMERQIEQLTAPKGKKG